MAGSSGKPSSQARLQAVEKWCPALTDLHPDAVASCVGLQVGRAATRGGITLPAIAMRRHLQQAQQISRAVLGLWSLKLQAVTADVQINGQESLTVATVPLARKLLTQTIDLRHALRHGADRQVVHMKTSREHASTWVLSTDTTLPQNVATAGVVMPCRI